jgi:hypothetical protein
MPFAKGKSGNPKGRPRGALSKSKVLLKELAQAIVGDLQVQNRLFQQARDGSIHPAVLVALFHYAAGKPPARVEVAPTPTRTDELVARLRLLPKADRLALAEMNRKLARLELPPGRVVDVTPAQAESAVK